MADYYVWHGSAQDDGDATWNSSTLAFLDLDTAYGTAAAGSDVWVAHDHSKTYVADTTLDNNGTATNPIKVTCVNRTTGAKATTAVEQTTGAADTLDFLEDGVIYDGINFKSGNSIIVDVDSSTILNNITIEMVTNAADNITWSGDDIASEWNNVQLKFANAGGSFRFGGGGSFLWRGGGIDVTGTALTSFLHCIYSRGAKIILSGLDLTNVASSVITMGTVITTGIFDVTFIGCKLPSGIPLLASSSFSVPHKVRAHSCDNGDGYYFFEETYLEGQIVQATNCYLNATYDGTNGYSAKMVSNANALDGKRPLRFKLAEFWADANPTLTVETITSNVTLQDDEFWIEIEYPNSTDQALRDIDKTSRQEVGWSGGSDPGTPVNLTTSTESWIEDLGSEVKQKISETISGGAAGVHTVWACLAKPSTTVYVDPKVTVS